MLTDELPTVPPGTLVSVNVPRFTLVPFALVLTGTEMVGDDTRLKAMPLAGTTGVTFTLGGRRKGRLGRPKRIPEHGSFLVEASGSRVLARSNQRGNCRGVRGAD